MNEIWKPLPENVNMSAWTIGGDGSLYAILTIWNWNETTGNSNNTYILAKYDAQGEELIYRDFTTLLNSDSYLGGIAVDGEGRVYIADHSSCSAVWLFDADGSSAGRIALDSGMGGTINSFCRGTDGRVYAAVAGNNGNDSDTMLWAIDFEKKDLEDICSGLPMVKAFDQNADGS